MRLRDILYSLAQEGQLAQGTYWKDDIEDLQHDLPHIREIASDVARDLGMFPEEVPVRIVDHGLEIEISH
ncbi:hypothetical protein [Gloeobacter kilaueensis]|uniref:Uncharacterized protein n=1 Tax=Gloeobacter kilaueensis (strain ATCC BAA-2537 / CCAP 1431/1 / ULC 316 / JS1) TaxID=1183438 RepID=U5QNT2_GLOK1|nr:hypothetical protein [Gloeobacter kilaueensis]AGY60657.1 hypothetical protein GKIL_4411 [Gloeobacter kilaueensis JS1]